MSRLRGVLVPGLVLALLAGCGPRERGPRVGPMGEESIPVRVENGSPANLRVYVARAGDEVLLGRVGPLRTSDFRLPPVLAGTLRLVVRPAAGRSAAEAHASEPFNVSAGQRVTWRLQGSPGTSNLPGLSSISVTGCGGGRC